MRPPPPHPPPPPHSCAAQCGGTQHGTTDAGMRRFHVGALKWEDSHPLIVQVCMKVRVCVEEKLGDQKQFMLVSSFIHPSVAFTSTKSLIGNMRRILVWNLDLVSCGNLRDEENWVRGHYLMMPRVLFGQYWRFYSHTLPVCAILPRCTMRKSVHSHKGGSISSGIFSQGTELASLWELRDLIKRGARQVRFSCPHLHLWP